MFGDVVAMNDVFYTLPKAPDVLKPFTEIGSQIPTMNTLRLDSLKAFADEQAGSAEYSKR